MKRLALASCMLIAASALAAERLDNLHLDQAVRIALQNHRSLKVSEAALDVAEAQYQQAIAAFGPRVNFEAGFLRNDQERSFGFNGTVQTPAVDVSALTRSPPGTLVIPGQTMPIKMDVKMFDRDVTTGAIKATYPLYTGGKKEAIAAMASKGIEIAREEKRKTELEVVHAVSKYYNGALLARQMQQLASDSLERFQVLEELTERLYQNASLKVKKTDFLRAKTTTAVTRTMLQEARYASDLTREALINAMGLPLNTPLSLAPEPALPGMNADLDALIADAMNSSPEKRRLELALQAADHKIDEAKSGYLPTIGLEATTYQAWNTYKHGLFNDSTRNGWILGIGLKWDLFNSGLTKAAVDSARAEKIKLEAQRALLDSGLALKLKDDVLRIQRSRAQVEDSAKAQGFAEENRKLNVRAYQEEMVETKDVIEAQIVESFTSAGFYRAQHELRAAVADLEFRVGRALQESRSKQP